MNIFRRLIDFIEGNAESLRFDVVSERLRNSELRYITVADSKREMREDFRRLRRDFDSSLRAYENGKESRTK